MADVGDAPRVAGPGLEAGRPSIAARIAASPGASVAKSQSVMSSCSTRAEPCSPWISVRFRRPGKALVAASITPSAPFLNRRTATAVSSTSIRSWARSRRQGLDRVDVAHQPLEQVDVVDRLVHQGTAAVEVPGPAPAARVVIRLGPPPLDVRVAQGQPAEPARRRSPP